MCVEKIPVEVIGRYVRTKMRVVSHCGGKAIPHHVVPENVHSSIAVGAKTPVARRKVRVTVTANVMVR